jgi:hypothetical protein
MLDSSRKETTVESCVHGGNFLISWMTCKLLMEDLAPQVSEWVWLEMSAIWRKLHNEELHAAHMEGTIYVPNFSFKLWMDKTTLGTGCSLEDNIIRRIGYEDMDWTKLLRLESTGGLSFFWAGYLTTLSVSRRHSAGLLNWKELERKWSWLNWCTALALSWSDWGKPRKPQSG